MHSEARCKTCGARWTSLRVEHCTACCETFAAARAGDSHRVGSFSDLADPRRCRTPDEMRAGGMWTETSINGTRIWHGEWNRAGVQRRRSPGVPLNNSTRRPRSDETRFPVPGPPPAPETAQNPAQAVGGDAA